MNENNLTCFFFFSVQSEMVYCRALSRLQSQLLKAQYVGTFTPIWNCIRDLIDGTTTAHLASLSSYQELLQRIGGYQEVFQRKTKNYIQKDNDISRTADLINHLKHARELVVHAKRLYHSQSLDYERVLRNHSNSNSTTDMSSVSGTIPRQVARSAKKLKQLKEEYKVAIEKYNNIRNEYVKVFTEGFPRRSFLLNVTNLSYSSSLLKFVTNFKALKLNTSNRCFRQRWLTLILFINKANMHVKLKAISTKKSNRSLDQQF